MQYGLGFSPRDVQNKCKSVSRVNDSVDVGTSKSLKGRFKILGQKVIHKSTIKTANTLEALSDGSKQEAKQHLTSKKKSEIDYKGTFLLTFEEI